jgi:hypothetical protein
MMLFVLLFGAAFATGFATQRMLFLRALGVQEPLLRKMLRSSSSSTQAYKLALGPHPYREGGDGASDESDRIAAEFRLLQLPTFDDYRVFKKYKKWLCGGSSETIPRDTVEVRDAMFARVSGVLQVIVGREMAQKERDDKIAELEAQIAALKKEI